MELSLSDGYLCCGVREIDGLESAIIHKKRSPERVLLEWVEDYNDGLDLNNDFFIGDNNPLNSSDGGFKFVIFSGVTERKAAQAFADYLKSAKLGKVMRTRSAVNPNTGNKIQLFVWEINHPRLLKWYKDRVKKEVKILPLQG